MWIGGEVEIKEHGLRRMGSGVNGGEEQGDDNDR